MTTAETHHARPNRFGQAWRGFRRWRRARPFWGGLFTALAGLEIFGTTQMSLNGLTFQMGPTGFLSWLIPVILVACGMLLWFSPSQRMFYAIVAAITAVYSLIGVNLGGFFIGLLLGMVGSALGFAWVPAKKPAPSGEPADEEHADDEEHAADEEHADDDVLGLVDELLPRQREDETTGVLTDTLPEPRNPLREPAPAEPPAGSADTTQVLPAVRPDGPEGTGHRDPKLYGILLLVASLATAGLLGIRGEQPAVAAPASCPTTTTAPETPNPSASASVSPSAGASPAAAETSSDGNLLTDLIDGITGLFTGGDSGSAEPSPAPTPSSSDAAAAAAEPTPTGATPTASTSATPEPSTSSSAKPSAPAEPGDDPCASPAPTTPKPVEAGQPLPKLAADPDQPIVADPPSDMTGSKVTMTGLRFEGIVELPTRDGTLKCLKFTMDKAVTEDFTLLATGPAGKKQRYVTNRLTVEGDVAFYATRFVGYLLGIKITLTPDLPFPDGLPITSPIPVTFTDPAIKLAYEKSKSLTATPTLKVDLA
ncbi:DUF6114 domain-containing protein [Micromonospora soli]|uniref:DUF6114 domain-containing protein n=1 Tax=Micromonospora sp. NBRC 110009 TaxID=3061627 RepID=UPI0026722CC9|nr:DUF6114 domain-containing protein [Micromonospora sp. NBRC 110009]WKU01180.1 DUF6114 domain-containing protein [Micromonospora sp. NBRC 110009]